jgi:hypothetical protein
MAGVENIKMFLVNRTIFFINGAAVNIILEMYSREREAKEACVVLNRALTELLPSTFEDPSGGKMNVKDVLMEVGIASVDHQVIKIESKSSIIETVSPIISHFPTNNIFL